MSARDVALEALKQRIVKRESDRLQVRTVRASEVQGLNNRVVSYLLTGRSFKLRAVVKKAYCCKSKAMQFPDEICPEIHAECFAILIHTYSELFSRCCSCSGKRGVKKDSRFRGILAQEMKVQYHNLD